MERSTKHRILGILVVIALVIISLPLFQTEKDAPTQTAAIKTPPFPDQPVQTQAATTPATPVALAVASAATTQPVEAPSTMTSTTPTVAPIEQKPAAAGNQAADTPDDQPDDVITTLHPSVVNAREPAENPAASTVIPVIANTATPETAKLAAKTANALAPKAAMKTSVKSVQAANTKNRKLVAKLAPRKHLAKTKPLVAVNTALKEDGLISLKNSAYVIQIGSFKNKTNALRLVNQLRANGYPAFIQKMSTALGENTRVFVGPSNKRTTATELASRLENDMHLKGIVISYQPLTL